MTKVGEHGEQSIRQPWRPLGKPRMCAEPTPPYGVVAPARVGSPSTASFLEAAMGTGARNFYPHGLSTETPEHHLEGRARAPKQREGPPSIRAMRVRLKAGASEKGTGVPGGAHYLSRCSAREGAELKDAVSAAEGLDSLRSVQEGTF